MQESRQERLKRHLFAYTRSLFQIQTSSLPVDSGRTTGTKADQSDREEDEEPASAGQQPVTLNHLRTKWKSLRSYALGDEEKETAMVGPSDVNVDALRYLESMVDTLSRRNDELEERRDEVLKQRAMERAAWTEKVEASEGDSDDGGTDRHRLLRLNVKLSQVERKLSFVQFRHSMAEVMLTQIALLDTIQAWGDFHPRGQKKDSYEPNKHEKRAIIIGCVLKLSEKIAYYLTISVHIRISSVGLTLANAPCM